MSKRSYRRLAVVAGAALAVGSMAPAMAARLDAGAGASADVDPALVVNDVTAILGTLPLPLPELGELPIPTYTQLNGTLLGVGGLGLGAVGLAGITANGLVDNVLDHVVIATGGLSGDCGLVSVLSCNTAPTTVAVPVNASGILAGGILSNTGDVLGGDILGGDLLGGDLLGGLGGILNLSGGANVNVIAGLLGSL